jgi:hypothetical protein
VCASQTQRQILLCWDSLTWQGMPQGLHSKTDSTSMAESPETNTSPRSKAVMHSASNLASWPVPSLAAGAGFGAWIHADWQVLVTEALCWILSADTTGANLLFLARAVMLAGRYTPILHTPYGVAWHVCPALPLAAQCTCHNLECPAASSLSLAVAAAFAIWAPVLLYSTSCGPQPSQASR